MTLLEKILEFLVVNNSSIRNKTERRSIKKADVADRFKDITDLILFSTAQSTVFQTDVVFPVAGDSSYAFPELIDTTVTVVHRGTGTTLRVSNSVANNEFAQFNSLTGEIIVSYPFSDAESLWVEYKTKTI